jgi:hypothetical protein
MPLRALLLRNGDADAELELALLQLWAAPEPERLSTELLALDDKCWRRLGLLLFSTESSLVLALVAVLERVATWPSSDRRLLRRLWRSQWRVHLREKLVDCHARLEREGARPECVGRTDSLGGVNLIAVRLVQILVSSLRALLTHDEQSPKNQAGLTAEEDGVNDAPKVMEVVDLLLFLSTGAGRTPAIAHAAAVGLHSLLSLEPHAFSGLLTTHICRSTALQHYVAWLVGGDGGGIRECDHTYFELLVAAAIVARSGAHNFKGSRSACFDDTAAMLEICTHGVASADSNIQYAALRLLSSLLALDDAASSALSSAVRLSGILISLSWLLSHAVPHIAAMAATTLEVVIQHSPPSDVLRAVIEQGCVIIYRALLSASSGAKKSPAQAAVAASCRSLLNWVTEEVAWQSGVVAASVQSVLSSTNTLLQKNIVLTLQILAQRNATIREVLEDQDFRTDALVAAIQADEEAGLAVSLLSTCLSCCDRCSTLKIEGSTKDASAVFQHDNNAEEQEEDEPADSAEQDLPIRLLCAEGQAIEVSESVLREHSNLLRGLKVERPRDLKDGSAITVAKLIKSRASSVQLFVDVLSTPQRDAVNALAEHQALSTLQELLGLADAVGSAKCWHATTSAICRSLSASNWLDILQFAATEVRHPTLVLRCIRFAIQLHDALGPRPEPQPGKEAQASPAGQERADLASALKTAAIAMSQELFLG